jgi:hypothetical protein
MLQMGESACVPLNCLHTAALNAPEFFVYFEVDCSSSDSASLAGQLVPQYARRYVNFGDLDKIL